VKTWDQYNDVVLRFRVGADTVELEPGEQDDRLDQYLDEVGADSLFVLPAQSPHRHRRSRPQQALRKARKRIEGLAEGAPLLEGELEPLRGKNLEPIPVVAAANVPRSKAIEAAKAGQLHFFYWATKGQALEPYPVQLTTEDGDDDTLEVARHGLSSLLSALREQVDEGLRVSAAWDGTARRFGLLAVLLFVLSAAIKFHGELLSFSGLDGDVENALGLAMLLTHPALVALLLFAGPLRGRLQEEAGITAGRDLTLEEGQTVWLRYVRHVLRAWVGMAALIAACRLVVVLRLGWLGLWGDRALLLQSLEVLGAIGRDVLAALWLMTTLIYSGDGRSTLRQVFSSRVVGALFHLAILLVVITFCAFAVSWVVKMPVGILLGMLPFDPPTWVELAAAEIAELGADVWLALMALGYAWIREREQFLLWATTGRDRERVSTGRSAAASE